MLRCQEKRDSDHCCCTNHMSSSTIESQPSSAGSSDEIAFICINTNINVKRARYIEASGTKEPDDKMADVDARPQMRTEPIDEAGAGFASGAPTTTRPICLEQHQVISANCPPAEKNSLHQENRHRRAIQHRYRKRPSSFDVSLIIRNKNKAYNTTTSGLVTNSTPSTLMRQPPPSWQSTSTSGSSTDTSDDSEIEFMYAKRKVVGPGTESLEEAPTVECHDPPMNNENTDVTESRLNDNDNPTEFVMSAADEAAFRMTIGRGHFSRSKKDRFLNNLRLEKRLNGLNKEFFELACRAHTRSMRRRHSGDLRRIV